MLANALWIPREVDVHIVGRGWITFSHGANNPASFERSSPPSKAGSCAQPTTRSEHIVRSWEIVVAGFRIQRDSSLDARAALLGSAKPSRRTQSADSP